MSGPPAARIDDPIGHANELGNFLAKAAGRLLGTIVDGLIIGAAAAAIVGATVLTGGVATVAIIAIGVGLGFAQNKASEAAGVELSVGKLGETLADHLFPIKVTKTGKISTGSSNILINRRKAARATEKKPLDEAICSRDSPIVLLAEGAEFVFFNQAVAVRQGDHTTCGAQVMEGSNNVLIGGPQARVRPVPEAIPKWARNLVKAVNIGLALYALIRCKPSSIKNLKSSFPCMLSFGMGAYGLYQSIVANPVHVATGAKVLDGGLDTDFVLPGALPIVWRRTYNSRDERANTLFGQGWNTSFNVELRIGTAPGGLIRSLVLAPGEACLIYVDDSGRETLFPLLEPGQSHISVAEGMELMRTEGGEFVMRTIDGLHRVFDLPLEQERIDATELPQLALSAQTLLLRRIEDRNGNFIELRYDYDRRLLEMTDRANRLLVVEYAQPFRANDPGTLRPSSIRLVKPAEGETPGELVRYRYDSTGQLNQVFNRKGELVRSFGYSPAPASEAAAGLKPDRYLMSTHVQPSGLQCNYTWAQFADGPRIVRHWTNDDESYQFEYPINVEDNPPEAPRLSGGATRVTDHLGRVQVWEWNARFECTSYTNPENETARFQYDALSQLVRETAPDGAVTELRWDDEGNLITIIDALGRRQVTRWVETLHLPSAHMGPDGKAWTYSYDIAGNLLSETDPAGQDTQYNYEERGLPISITDAKGGIKYLRWNQRALLTSYTDCSNRTTNYEWDGWGFLRRTIDAKGYASEATHDADGNLLALATPDGAHQNFAYERSGQLRTAIDALGRKTQFDFNIRSQLTTRLDAESRQVALGYDAAHRLSQLTNENGESFNFQYDQADRLIEERRVGGQRVTVEYDLAGWPVAVTHYPGLGDELIVHGSTAAGQTPEIPGWGDQASTSAEAAPLARRTELLRDLLGRLIEKRTAQHCYRYEYDLRDQMVSASKLKIIPLAQGEPELQPLHTTSFAYDVVGNLISEIGTDHSSGESYTLHHSHDPLGNRTQTVLPDIAGQGAQRALNYLYYGSGHLHQINFSHRSKTAPDAQAVHQLISDMERDELHQEILRTQGKANTRFAYDPVGRLTGAWSQSSSLTSQPFGPKDPGASTWQQVLESLQHVSTSAGSRGMQGLVKAWRYDKVGELRASRHSLNGDTGHQYDATGRIMRTEHGALAGARNSLPQAANESFGYDPAGNIQDSATQQVVQSGTVLSQRGYVRDNLVRVFEDKRYFYDGHGRLIRKLAGKHTEQIFTWDEENNLIEVRTTRRPGTELATIQTTGFDYDAIGRRVAKHDKFGITIFIWEGMRLIEERRGSAVISYVYANGNYVPLARLDADGDQTQQGGQGTSQDAVRAELVRNTPERMAARELQTGANDINDLTRDPRSTIAANDGIKTQFGQVVSSGNASQQRNTLGNGATGQAPLCKVYYFHTDQVGMPQELSNAQGQLVWQASYKTWGSTLSEEWGVKTLAGNTVHKLDEGDSPKAAGDQQQNLRFQGQYLDRETGLNYNTFRYYDSDMGRFICPDPIGLQGGINLGSYSPNPLMWIDPWGWAATPLNKPGYTVYGLFRTGETTPYYIGHTNQPIEDRLSQHRNTEYASQGGAARADSGTRIESMTGKSKDMTYTQAKGAEQAYREKFDTKGWPGNIIEPIDKARTDPRGKSHIKNYKRTSKNIGNAIKGC